ncbi:hypothetical protein EII20_10575 [Comamonadaceae bacterium OH2545_COT-014]|nr:hypothetical protein EII20_10575 [Comamonadaceae bacterium OH2545_COT-014]
MIRKWIFFCICAIGLSASSAFAREVRFDLMGPQGRVTEKSYPGKYLLLAIGYTSCPDICPTTLYEYGLTMKAIQHPYAIQPIFVTIDPVNDEIDRLNAYTKYFDERIVGLSGKMENIKHLADQLGATFGYRIDGKKIENPQKGIIYNVYHSALIYLIGPDRKLVDVYDYQLGAQGLTAALDKVLGDGNKNASNVHKQSQEAQPSSLSRNNLANPVNPRHACTLPAGFQAIEDGTALKDILPQQDTASYPRLTLLNIWASWCAPCRAELPLLDKFAASQQSMAVRTVNLNEKESDIESVFSKMGIKHLPPTRTQDTGLLKRMGATGLPLTAIFLDGKQIARKGGIISQTDDLARYAQCMLNHGY